MNSKIINFNDKQFEFVNAIEIKELNAKYLIGKYVGTQNSRILSFIFDGVNYIIDSGKLTDIEKEVLNRYFAFADGIKKFKQALLDGEIISLYHEMPDNINALYEDVSLRNIEIKNEETDSVIKEEETNDELKPIVISSTKVEITSPNSISKEIKKISLDKVDTLISNLQSEIDRYYDLVNGLVNNG